MYGDTNLSYWGEGSVDMDHMQHDLGYGLNLHWPIAGAKQVVPIALACK